VNKTRLRVSTKVGLLRYDGRPSGSGLDLASASASAICSGPALVDRQSGLHDPDGSRRILGEVKTAGPRGGAKAYLKAGVAVATSRAYRSDTI
jgi:hypothetical protein